MEVLPTTPKTPRTPGSARKRASSFRLELPGDDSSSSMIKEKMKMIKDIYRERRECVNNSDAITGLDALIRSEGCESSHAAPAPRTPEDDRYSHYLFLFFDWFKFL